MDLKSFYGLTLAETEKLVADLGFPKYRAQQLLEWIYQRHIESLEDAKNLPKDFKEALLRDRPVTALEFFEAKDSGNGESVKYLFRTRDAHLLESVLITQQDRQTVCVSTQLGCKMGCVFCASGKGKFLRNLTAGEIVEQVARIARKAGKITNVVFMGMGEPMDNFEATMQALDILQAPWGFGYGARRITVSTSGITPKIAEFVERQQGRVRLSISLHAGNDEKRNQLMPVNRKYDLTNLIGILSSIKEDLKRSITFEYTLIEDVNDSDEDAMGVAKIAAPLGATVNVIPYNPIRELDWKTPSRQTMERFQQVLERYKARVTLRATAGRDIDGACGQLRLDRESGL